VVKDLTKAHEISLPERSPLKDTLSLADYEDAFARVLPGLAADETAEQLVHRMLRDIPVPFLTLLKMKERVLSPFGFSNLDFKRFQWQDMGADERVGIFVNKPFTAHIGISIDRNQKKVILSSRVRFHNLLGRSYMALVKPAHKAVFKFLLNRL
jgi:hypothetical protein